MATRLSLEILPQPDDVTCGPTCLHAVYRFFGDDLPIEQILREVRPHESRGTLAVLLAQHALERGYKATLWVYALDIFDPTWFRTGVDVRQKLANQMIVKSSDARSASTMRAPVRRSSVTCSEATRSGGLPSWYARSTSPGSGLCHSSQRTNNTSELAMEM